LHFAEPVECTDTESWRTKVCVALPGAGRKPRELHMPKSSWRDVLPIHPAAELFSCALMSSDEKRALGEDIVKNGLTSPIVLWKPDRKSPECLLDGITRLDAIEIATGCPAIVGAPSVTAGKDFLACNKVIVLDKSVDPYSYVISANIRRRHLTAEQKRDLIAKLLKADPSKSDRQIGEMIKADNKTVASVRAEKEAREEIPHVETRIDSRGRTQHARKPRNPERAKINREMKLGTEIMEKIAGTSLATAREHDALIFLNRGAPEGGHTDDVKRLVADAVAGRCVSAVEWKNNGGPLRGDIGPDSNGECERLRDRIEELENEKYRLERSYIALRDEIGGGKPGLAEKLEPPSKPYTSRARGTWSRCHRPQWPPRSPNSNYCWLTTASCRRAAEPKTRRAISGCSSSERRGTETKSTGTKSTRRRSTRKPQKHNRSTKRRSPSLSAGRTSPTSCGGSHRLMEVSYDRRPHCQNSCWCQSHTTRR
jgi:hypothetical protein